MNENVALVITSISSPNKILEQFAKGCQKHHVKFIIIGDKKSPDDFHLSGCNFFGIDKQTSMPFKLAEHLPFNHYSRKNLGYLTAMLHHAEIIIDSDDDNLPQLDFWENRQEKHQVDVYNNASWLNIYTFFSDSKIWPRGFPLKKINQDNIQTERIKVELVNCPIQQGLADLYPDVDSIYALTGKFPIRFMKNKNIAIGNNTWCPFNSQNTTWFKDAFPLMYLPSHCTFRMTDIWRSFVAQRILWTLDLKLLFHQATVIHQRNEHDIMKDFEQEIPGYLNNEEICNILEKLNLKTGPANIFENLLVCYEALISKQFLDKKEFQLLNKWITDIKTIRKNA